ncbi:hypothetical protein SAMN05216315_11823 [Nitrosospira sp. Nsp18]|uniref:hypothetical protein n=1 Tax=Nitrosospira sp. Nsp18 TaxID=1855334 RepID=UPI00087E0EE2|nr:hypothetical protein [Nitrosospira sp. Nsp18]SDA22380.1 hypothetical protein SAMN05216315_11823 [Nitrosospira sp. Nsp18]
MESKFLQQNRFLVEADSSAFAAGPGLVLASRILARSCLTAERTLNELCRMTMAAIDIA